jgi:hypothetical protein
MQAKQHKNTNSKTLDDCTIEGCKYQIHKDMLLDVLSKYGKIVTNITENLFQDGSDPLNRSGGTNRTGNYSVSIRLNTPIPQLLILGQKIKLNYSIEDQGS